MLHIRRRKQPDVDATENPLELAGIGARLGDLGEVDVEPNVFWQVGLAAGDDGVGQVGGQLGIDETAPGRRDDVPRQGADRGTRECNGGDALLDGVHGPADSAGKVHLQVDVAADVRSGDDKVRSSAVPGLGAKRVDAVPDARDGKRVDPIEARRCRVAADRPAVGRAAVVLTCAWPGIWLLIR